MTDGDIIKAARQQCGFTQDSLAKAAGMTKPHIGMIECGRRRFPRSRFAALPKPIRLALGPALISEHEAIISELREAMEQP